MDQKANSSFNRIDRNKLNALREREDKLFGSRIKKSARLYQRASSSMPGGVPMGWMRGLFRTPPIYVQHGKGPRFFDIDGNCYLDYNVCDLSMTVGFDAKPIARAVSEQAAKGSAFMMPTEDTVEVCEQLTARTGMPSWQFTLSASGANTEVIRVARFLTGRTKIVVFNGHYHGHIDETLVKPVADKTGPALLGLPDDAGQNTIIVPFNDLSSLEKVLASRDVALVITEPALTNCNLVLPEPGFLEGIRELTTRYDTLFCLDEAHTFQFAYGGLVRHWQLTPDFQVLGKGLGTGVSFALYGMTRPIADAFESHIDCDIGPDGIATGGTMYGTALAVAAAKAGLLEILTPDSYQKVCDYGDQLANGLEDLFKSHALPWSAFRLGPRSGYCLSESLPRNFDEAAHSLDSEFIDARRVYMANRGIWDAVASAGPQVSHSHAAEDVNEYLDVADQFLEEIIS